MTTTNSGTPATPARGLPRPLLWGLVALAVIANGLSSLSPLPTAVGATFGIIALTLGALLIRDHYRPRSRSTTATPP